MHQEQIVHSHKWNWEYKDLLIQETLEVVVLFLTFDFVFMLEHVVVLLRVPEFAFIINQIKIWESSL